MKRFHAAITTTSVLLAAIAFAPAAQAEYKCANPQGFIEQRTCEMAKAGPDTLRRFIYRTRGIYNLYFWDYVPAG